MEPGARFPNWELNLTLTESQQSRVRGLPSGWPDLVTSHKPVRPGGRVNMVRDERVLTLHSATWRAVHASEALSLHPGARQRCVVPVAGWRTGPRESWGPGGRDEVHWVAALWSSRPEGLTCTLLTVGERGLMVVDGWALYAWLGGWDAPDHSG